MEITRKDFEYLQYKAGQEVRKAISRKQLAKISEGTKCSYCGKQATGYDHRDYNKPLEVKPSCRSCNRTLPTALPGYFKVKQKYKWEASDGVESAASFSGACNIPIDSLLEDHFEYCMSYKQDKDCIRAIDELIHISNKKIISGKTYQNRFKYVS